MDKGPTSLIIPATLEPLRSMHLKGTLVTLRTIQQQASLQELAHEPISIKFFIDESNRKCSALGVATGGNPMQAIQNWVVEAGQRRDGRFMSFRNVICLTLGLITQESVFDFVGTQAFSYVRIAPNENSGRHPCQILDF
jgi:hypothetical protein